MKMEWGQNESILRLYTWGLLEVDFFILLFFCYLNSAEE